MFNSSKYGNLLTIILIITIVAIIGIVCIMGYRIYNAYYIDAGATHAATQFEDSLKNQLSNDNDIVNNVVENTKQNKVSVNISGVEDTTLENLVTSKPGTGSSTTKYKGFDVVGTIQIPSINLKYPILSQLTKKSLETSVVLMYSANGLNNEGNSVIIGHNYRNGTMFSNVKKMQKGDYIYIIDSNGKKIRYKVYNIYRASGSESSYMTRNTNGKREISLSTCTDDSKARTIVLARED